MTSREYIQIRIGDYERENERLSGLAACLRRKLEENDTQIAINKRLIDELRWVCEEQPMSEEALRALASAANAQQQSVGAVQPQQTPEGARRILGIGKS